MKRKIFSVLFALVLALSLSLVTAVPAVAQDGVKLQTEGNGVAEWSDAPPKTGSYSVKLSAPDASASARPVIPYGDNLSSVESISFWTYIETADKFPGLASLAEYWADGVAREGYLAPYITLELDTDGDDIKDDWLILYHYGEDTKGEWVQRSLEEGFHTSMDDLTGQSYWHSIMNESLVTWPKPTVMGYVGNTGTLEQWQGTSLGDAIVLNIKIPLGEGPGFAGMEAYVDDITINGVFYDLELPAARPLTVDDDRDEYPDAPFQTIQGAVDCAIAGDTISVAVGRYAEQIVIDQALTLMGESRDGVIIDGSSFIETNIKGVWINSSNVTVKDLTVENFGPQWCYSILAIEQVDEEGGAHPVDIATEDKTLNPLSYVKIENVKFDNNATGPYLVYSQNSTVQDCFITDQLGDGIWMSWGCDDARIVGNEVINSGNQGIWLGRHWRGSPPVTKDGVIQDNMVNGALEAGIWFAGDGCTIENNEVMNIQGAGWSNGAVTLGVNAATSNVVMRYNKIHDNSTHGIGISAASDVTQTHINYNNICGNTDWGLNNSTGTEVDAKYNWWGGVAGPRHSTNPYNDKAIAAGSDNVTDNVDYLPWMIHTELAEGWNIYSTPIAPDVDSSGTIDKALDLCGSSSGDKLIAYYYDSENQSWDEPTSLTPLQAVYIKMAAAATIDVVVSSDATFPPSTVMHVGWNLVGPAELGKRLVDIALTDAYLGTGVAADLQGYSKALSPPLYQSNWTYLRGGDSTEKDFVPTEGYWVLMVNQGILGGVTTTPIYYEVP